MSKTPYEVDKRNRFKVNRDSSAKAIKESKLLYNIWDKEKAPAASAYNKICKINFKLCNTNRPSVQNLITPGGFNLPVESVSYFPDKIEAELKPFDILPGEKRVIFIMMICFYEPVRSEADDAGHLRELKITTLRSLGLLLILTLLKGKLLSAYKSRMSFLAAVTQDEAGNILRWSESISREL